MEWRRKINMLLTPEKSLCEKNQAIVVSKDRGNQREHRATNPLGLQSYKDYSPYGSWKYFI